jgi:hypothetical protein
VSLARYTVTPGGRIDTREELLAALDVAAELEHTLLVQYLFAATSCRKRPDGGFDERRMELVRDWEASLLGIAREEMVHLATVTKIAVAVGGAPHLEPPAFPQPAGAQFPFDLSLNRLTLRAVDRFVRFEAPGEVVLAETFAIAPDPVEFEFIGELYRQIITAIRLLAATRGEAWLLVGPQEVRAEESWGLHHVVRGIDGAQSTITALDEIITEGEGGQRDAATSHWQRFQRVREGWPRSWRAIRRSPPHTRSSTTPRPVHDRARRSWRERPGRSRSCSTISTRPC